MWEEGIDIPGRDNKRCALNLIRVCVPIASRMSCDKQQQLAATGGEVMAWKQHLAVGKTNVNVA